MGSRLRVIGLVLLAVAGCAGPVTPSPSPSPAASAVPAGVGSRSTLPSCGVERATTQNGPWNEAARACFWQAYLARRPAEFATTRLTIEGDPVTSIYRVLGDGTVEVLLDSTQDRYGSGGWQRLTCPTLVIEQTNAPAPDFVPGEACAETPLR